MKLSLGELQLFKELLEKEMYYIRTLSSKSMLVQTDCGEQVCLDDLHHRVAKEIRR